MGNLLFTIIAVELCHRGLLYTLLSILMHILTTICTQRYDIGFKQIYSFILKCTSWSL